MKKITIQFSGRFQVFQIGPHEVYWQGVIKRNDKELFGQDLVEVYHDLIGCHAQDCLDSLSGFYNLLIRTGNTIVMLVDHIRSLPIFYCDTQFVFYISNDAEWIRRTTKTTKMDGGSRSEFCSTGYVTGNDTLFRGINQLQAGEFFHGLAKPDLIESKSLRYYTFRHQEPSSFDQNKIDRKLSFETEICIQNLIKYAGGRQIVIPLSGGYDSRLIAAYLKKLNYRNIITFTYGLRDNREAKYSKTVADALGLRWIFIEYSENLWRAAWLEEDRQKYQIMASNWSSLPHMQDWLAVKHLKSQNLVDEDCVFVPGHSGDFIAGSHIPSETFFEKQFSTIKLIKAILDSHYTLGVEKTTLSISKKLYQRISNTVSSLEVKLPWQFADGFELWDWQERQSKFICNSVRVYEYFGYDWWLPLWDIHYAKFWQTVPLKLRQNRFWYLNFVQDVYKNASVDVHGTNIGNASDRIWSRFLWLQTLSKTRFVCRIKKFGKQMFSIGTRHEVWVSWAKESVPKTIQKSQNTNTVEIYLFLDCVDKLILENENTRN